MSYHIDTNNTRCETIPNRYTFDVPDPETPRSIRFPRVLWDAIDAEAKKCRRSSVKQMEVVLSAYYGLDDITNSDIDRSKIGQLRAETDSVEATINGREIAPKSSSRPITHYEGEQAEGEKKNKVG